MDNKQKMPINFVDYGNVYLDNVKNDIQRQIRWSGISGKEKLIFLNEIIQYCELLKTKKIKKSPKTRHGSGRK